MALIRANGAAGGARAMSALLPDPTQSRYATSTWVAADARYAWGTQVDDAGLAQMLQLWQDGASGTSRWPAFAWWNSTLTDAAQHAGGPRSPIARAALRDADRRLGVFLDQLDRLGVYDDVVFLLTADHGFEAADSDCRGDWDSPLRQAGLVFRDEGPGFVYLGEDR
jgi:membrane-anchored protein YejM (alkaline phosphatase superfamily)